MNYENLYLFLEKERLDSILKTEPSGYYLSYAIRKSNGKKRWIDAPIDDLKFLQNQILDNILVHEDPHPAAIGFRRGHSLVEGADQHLGAKGILNIDLKDFFHSITKDQLYKIIYRICAKLKNNGISEEFNQLEKESLIKLVTFKGRLPQGAPTSPALSNLASTGMDELLNKYSQDNGLVYTRYADDMSFSHKTGDIDFMEVLGDVTQIIKTRTSFSINPKKTRIRRDHQRMEVTGIVINDKKGVPKWKRRNFRATLHNLEKSQKEITKEEWENLNGYAQWIHQLNPSKGEKFLDQIGRLNYKK